MVPPRAPSFGTSGASLVRSGESAVSPPRAGGRCTISAAWAASEKLVRAHGATLRMVIR
jgi:hypothetical protein